MLASATLKGVSSTTTVEFGNVRVEVSTDKKREGIILTFTIPAHASKIEYIKINCEGMLSKPGAGRHLPPHSPFFADINTSECHLHSVRADYSNENFMYLRSEPIIGADGKLDVAMLKLLCTVALWSITGTLGPRTASYEVAVGMTKDLHALSRTPDGYTHGTPLAFMMEASLPDLGKIHEWLRGHVSGKKFVTVLLDEIREHKGRIMSKEELTPSAI